MERLTIKNLRLGFDDSDKLPSYVDIYERLRKYEDLEEKGLLIKLPCQVGDTVYCIINKDICDYKIIAFDIYDNRYSAIYKIEYDDRFGFGQEEFYKTVFLTKEDAKKALKSEE